MISLIHVVYVCACVWVCLCLSICLLTFYLHFRQFIVADMGVSHSFLCVLISLTKLMDTVAFYTIPPKKNHTISERQKYNKIIKHIYLKMVMWIVNTIYCWLLLCLWLCRCLCKIPPIVTILPGSGSDVTKLPRNLLARKQKSHKSNRKTTITLRNELINAMLQKCIITICMIDSLLNWFIKMAIT